MASARLVAVLVSAALFLGYGSLCLLSDGMRAEFERFGLSRFRRLTGGLEVLGGVGLLVGLLVPAVLVAASAGLALLMLLGVIARVRVRDPFVELLPAGVLLVANLFILLSAWDLVGPAWSS
jgi:uncharacterized membrane protein YphA (DoxX/SURF4 family)